MMDRRRFLRDGLAGLGLVGLFRRVDAAPWEPVSGHDLAIVKGPDIAANVKAAVDGIGGIEAFVKPGSIVLLKPNFSFPNPPEWGSTTHPGVVQAVTELCFNAGAKRVVAVDYPMSRAEACFERSGLSELRASLRELTFVELKDESQFETVPVVDGHEVRELMIARLIGKADTFINLPTAKAHSATQVSFGLKNLMGLFWNRWPFHQQYDLHKAIADLATTMKPALTILDAEYLLLTNGPQGPGRTVRLGTVIAGRDPVAVDAAGCGLAEWNNRVTRPETVRHIIHTAEKGIGTLDLGRVKVLRKDLS